MWVLSIPLPHVPPLVLAAIARSGKEKVADLVKFHSDIMDLLHAQDIAPLSMSSDGASSERSLGRTVAESAHSHWRYTIPSKHLGASIELKIPLCKCHGLPCNVCQDNKHALKTGRNQMQTGARLLSMGNFTVLYSYLRDIAENTIGPLFRRDVERVDKQDDRAASRTFSSAVLSFIHRFFPERHGLSVYLFVVGELVDAWQNRSIRTLNEHAW